MQFDEVIPDHFNIISRTPLPHVLIEQALMQLGGGGIEGTNFKRNALLSAGWKHASVVSYGKHPTEAASAFNVVRAVLAASQNPTEIMEKLQEK
ncbi:MULTISPECIES: hypothetical protein [unclassified Iodobacter]|uniref:hypothetical protein n=1 Tax=unclassified Iodobacter TaxID=235634 RepID=UPI0025F8AAB5|nr:MULTISPECIES: hypothetical protein [unclassified Iodobacter]MDW5416297.1 hypothetical protein [Iodobacter sp. CM08]